MTRAVTALADAVLMRLRRPSPPPIPRVLCYACGCEQTPADRAARRCTQCHVRVLPRAVTDAEHQLATLAIALLRDGGMSDNDILDGYTTARPGPDRVYEREYLKEHGVKIAADRVKVQMRRLLRH